ncbi:class B sortase [Adlercreutzia sp. ZJ141]|uniref:class B sortase n=1 Tax=Adlercreutzia sp. ZJ141 TaxID=2709406 RepID=UPI0013E9F322|nr:class B sortase [Adlercreutzia sp. ZJ141]
MDNRSHQNSQDFARPVRQNLNMDASQYGRANYGSAARKSASGMMPATVSGGGMSMPPQKKRGSKVLRVVIVLALVVLLVSLLALGTILFSYWQGRQTYNDIANEGFMPPSDVAAMSLSDLQVDWDALRAINPDVVGWIYIPNTNINYPIVHRSDNDYYLTHDFTGSEGWLAVFGCIFLSAENAADFSDDNNVVYGHNMNDGSMFSDIAGLEDQGAFDASRTVYILTPQGNYRLLTCSLVHCSGTEPLAQTEFSSPDEFERYLQDKIDRSVVSADDIVEASDMKKAFTLSTCDNLASNGRWVLFAYVTESTVATDQNAYGNAEDINAADAVSAADEEAISGAAQDVAA